jgi:hypothetical protein
MVLLADKSRIFIVPPIFEFDDYLPLETNVGWFDIGTVPTGPVYEEWGMGPDLSYR